MTSQFSNKRRKQRVGMQEENLWGYAFIGVALLIFLVFTVYPLFDAFQISFEKFRPLGRTWVGLKNHETMLHDKLFWQAIKNTAVYTAGTVPVNLIISFAMAILIYPFRKSIQTAFKALYYLPAVASGVALAVVWQWLYDPLPGGAFNRLLAAFGSTNQNWLGSSKTAMFSLLLMSWLSSHGTSIIIYIAALLGISGEYYEAADLDGATFFQKLWRIVIPLLKPTTLFLLVTGIINSFQVFMNAYLMTGGGPDHSTNMVGLLIFDNAFKYSEYGKAAAQALVLMVVVAIISFVQFKLMGNEVEY